MLEGDLKVWLQCYEEAQAKAKAVQEEFEKLVEKQAREFQFFAESSRSSLLSIPDVPFEPKLIKMQVFGNQNHPIDLEYPKPEDLANFTFSDFS